jgi:Zn-dependent alcohol dehydrogenase
MEFLCALSLANDVSKRGLDNRTMATRFGEICFAATSEPRLLFAICHAFRLVIGAGPIGMVTALAAGCSQVVISDVQEPKLELARTLGAIVPVKCRQTESLPGG